MPTNTKHPIIKRRPVTIDVTPNSSTTRISGSAPKQPDNKPVSEATPLHHRLNDKQPAAPPIANKAASRVAANRTGQPPPISYVFKPEVLERSGVSYVSIWSWMRQGKFPQSYDVGGRVAWRAHEFEQWLETRPVRKLKPASAEA